MRLAHSSAPRMPRRPLWLALAATILLAPVLLLLIVPRLTAAHPQQSSVSTWPGVWSRVADLPLGSFPGPLILLETGKVLLGNDVSSPGIYNPATNTWSSTKPWGQVANFGQLQFTPLNDGRLLENVADPSRAPIAGIYDPRSDSWTNVQPMPHSRDLFSTITLRDGRVLFIGGQQSTYTGTPALQTDVYDPASNSWTVTGSIAAPRTNPIVLLLHDGRVMMLGGRSPNPSCSDWCGTASVEIFDPKAGTWSPGASLPKALYDFTATLLPSGKVLVAGGADPLVNLPSDAYPAYADAELYDPTSNTWSAAAPMSSARVGHSATLLPSGRVLVAGGQSGANYWTSAEVYDPASNTWLPTGSMPHHHVDGHAVALSNGQVFVSSGNLGPGECFGSLPGGAIAAVARVPRIPQVPLGPARPGCGAFIHEEDMYSTVPGTPTNVHASTGIGSATVTWTAPVEYAGGAITGYTVTAEPGGATTTVGGNVTSATLTGLTLGTSYTFSVAATNAAGTGPASARSNPVVPRAQPTPTPPAAHVPTATPEPTATATPSATLAATSNAQTPPPNSGIPGLLYILIGTLVALLAAGGGLAVYVRRRGGGAIQPTAAEAVPPPRMTW